MARLLATGTRVVLFVVASAAQAQSKATISDRPLPQDATRTTPNWAVLRQAVESRDYSVRLLAVQALGDIRNVDVTRWMARCLGDPEHDVRIATVDALKRISSPSALVLLRSVRDDKSEALDVRALAAAALIARSAD